MPADETSARADTDLESFAETRVRSHITTPAHSQTRHGLSADVYDLIAGPAAK